MARDRQTLRDYYREDRIWQIVRDYGESTGESVLILDMQGETLATTFAGKEPQSELSTIPIFLPSGEQIFSLVLEKEVARQSAGRLIKELISCYVERNYLEKQAEYSDEESIEIERAKREIESTLGMVGMGTWSLIIPEEGKPQFFADTTMNQLLGTAEDMDPVERYEFWYQRIVPETRKNTEACFNHIMENGSSEVEYEWMHPTFGHQYVRGGAILDVGFRGAIRVKGWHQDITEQIQYNIAIREADKAIDALSSVFASVWTVNIEDKKISIIKDHNVLTDYFKRAEESIEKKEPVLIRDLVAKEFLPELNRYLDYDRLARELTQKEVISWEFRLVDENWERLVMIPLQKNTQGLVTKILFSVQEITEEKEKELENQFQLAEANRRARLQLETIASGIPGGFKISRNDKEFSFKYISQQFAAMLGYTVDEVKRKKGMLELVHPEDVEEQMEIARQMYRQGNTYVMKYRIHCKNGSWKYVMDRGRKVFLDNGDFEHWCLILDIDEQEKLNRLLRQERKQYREALVQDSIFFFHVDMNDGFLYDDFMLNGEAWLSELYDITFPIHIDELGKLVFKNMIPLTQRESGEGLCTAKEIIQMCEGGQNRFEFEYYAISIEEYHRMDFYMRQDEETGHSMVSVIGRNITRQKTEMEKAYQEAKRANAAKKEFLSRMSHDIRTPMNGILGMTRIAKDCMCAWRRTSLMDESS